VPRCLLPSGWAILADGSTLRARPGRSRSGGDGHREQVGAPEGFPITTSLLSVAVADRPVSSPSNGSESRRRRPSRAPCLAGGRWVVVGFCVRVDVGLVTMGESPQRVCVRLGVLTDVWSGRPYLASVA